MKVCFTASSGGHLSELLMLKPLMEKYDSFLLTESTGYEVPVDGMKTYYLKQVNRKDWRCWFKFLGNCARSLGIFLREKPDLVVTTGVLAVIPMCLLCKLFRRKLVFIESFAKITSPTLTGRFLYRFADRFYVQWESMLEVYPKATYIGKLY